MKNHGNYWRAGAYMAAMTYGVFIAASYAKEYPEAKFIVALSFIGVIVALSVVYVVLSRED